MALLATTFMSAEQSSPAMPLQPLAQHVRTISSALASVNQCWTQKSPRIAPAELEDARRAYDHAREVYRTLIAESRPGT